MKRISCLAFVVLAVVSLFSCTTLKPYRVIADPHPAPNGTLNTSKSAFNEGDSKNCQPNHPDTCAYVVEFDEFGNVFNREQMKYAIRMAQETAEQHGDIFVYVHGWHHSGKFGDEDLDKFTTSINQAHTVTGKKTTGIFIAWRGESINSRNPLLFVPSIFTFWSRKSTAHNVGNGGGVSELIGILSSLRHHNVDSRLTLIGHSFGGAVLFSSVSHLLVEQFRQDAGVTEAKDIPNFTPIADLVVLINPAFEAMRLAPLYAQARQHDYIDRIPPRLVIVTSKADWATHWTFPIGRLLGTALHGYPDNFSRMQNISAIGHYEPFITHQLVLGDCSTKGLIDQSFNIMNFNQAMPGPTYEKCFSGAGKHTIVLSRCDVKSACNIVTDDHVLKRGPVAEGNIPTNFPIVNIRTDANLIGGHTEIWGKDFKYFVLGLLTSTREGDGVPHLF